MKNLKIISGAICFAVGLIMLIASTTLSRDMAYLCKVFGVILLLFGIINLIVVLVSQAFTSKNLKDKDDFQVSMTKCPNCGIQLKSETKVCPKCKTVIKS
ncbi:MAG: zinc ribbon domain-containing protein [Oscillospiraceae bacterium]|nr:zinc ribbon domain-containing protein [Oscillospiraceae bacterium]